MIEVRLVTTKKEQKEFLDFPLKLYKGNQYYAPALYLEEKRLFKKNYYYYATSDAYFYNAYKDGIIVGRIAAILQKVSNEIRNEKKIRFNRFDCINDQEVANALFDKVEELATTLGMKEVIGPLGFSDIEREGLLIEGFDQVSTFAANYNYPYYQTLIENYGFKKDVDWYERRLLKPKEVDFDIQELKAKIMKRYNLHFGTFKNMKDFKVKYYDKLWELVDITYGKLYQTVPFIDEVRKEVYDNFKIMVSMDKVRVILDENERMVSFGFMFPLITKALQKSGGHLTIPSIFKVFKTKKKPKEYELGLIGVLPEYEMKGVSSLLILSLMEFFEDENVEAIETNLMLEYNIHIQNQWKKFESIGHKKHRSFIKTVGVK